MAGKKVKEARLNDHREASRTEKGAFAQFLVGHNDAVLCAAVSPCLPSSLVCCAPFLCCARRAGPAPAARASRADLMSCRA
jgi:hypothetical protein